MGAPWGRDDGVRRGWSIRARTRASLAWVLTRREPGALWLPAHPHQQGDGRTERRPPVAAGVPAIVPRPQVLAVQLVCAHRKRSLANLTKRAIAGLTGLVRASGVHNDGVRGLPQPHAQRRPSGRLGSDRNQRRRLVSAATGAILDFGISRSTGR